MIGNAKDSRRLVEIGRALQLPRAMILCKEHRDHRQVRFRE